MRRVSSDDPPPTTIGAMLSRWGARIVVVALAAALVGCSAVRAEPHITIPLTTPTASPTPELPQTLIGWSGDDIPGVDQEVFGTWLARDSWAGMARGEWLFANDGYKRFVAAHPDRAVDIGVPLIPHDSGRDLNSLLAEGASGARDAEYESLGRWLGSNGTKTVYARLYWEMNMSPEPADSLDRGAFIAAWNHAVPLLRKGFAEAAPDKQLFIVFCPLTDGADYQAFYPDDANVDIIAIDAYGAVWSSDTPLVGVLLDVVRRQLAGLEKFARQHGKPLALGEWANWNAGTSSAGTPGGKGRGDFPEYVDLIFDWAERVDAKYIVYFNLASGGVEQTLNDTPMSLGRLQGRAAVLQQKGP